MANQNSLDMILVGTERSGTIVSRGKDFEVLDTIYPLISINSDNKPFVYSAKGVVYDVNSSKKIENSEAKNMKFFEVVGSEFDRKFYTSKNNEVYTLDRKLNIMKTEKMSSEIKGITKIDNEAIIFLEDGTAQFYGKQEVKSIKVDDEIKKIFGKDNSIYVVGKNKTYEFTKEKGFNTIMNMEDQIPITGITKTPYGTIITTESSIHNLTENKITPIFRSFATTGSAIKKAEYSNGQMLFTLDNCKVYACDAEKMTSEIYTHGKTTRSKTIEEFPEIFKQIFTPKGKIESYNTSQIYHDAKLI